MRLKQSEEKPAEARSPTAGNVSTRHQLRALARWTPRNLVPSPTGRYLRPAGRLLDRVRGLRAAGKVGDAERACRRAGTTAKQQARNYGRVHPGNPCYGTANPFVAVDTDTVMGGAIVHKAAPTGPIVARARGRAGLGGEAGSTPDARACVLVGSPVGGHANAAPKGAVVAECLTAPMPVLARCQFRHQLPRTLAPRTRRTSNVPRRRVCRGKVGSPARGVRWATLRKVVGSSCWNRKKSLPGLLFEAPRVPVGAPARHRGAGSPICTRLDCAARLWRRQV